jgi:ribosomal protein L11 methyltransferase
MAAVQAEVWRIAVTVPAEAVDAVTSLLEDHSETVTWFMVDQSGGSEGEGDWTIEGYGRVPPDRSQLAAGLEVAATALRFPVPEAVISRVPDTDWVSETMRNFPPIDAGRFFVHGSHFEGAVPAGRIGLMIDAGTAFGSGEHATTWSCLMALSLISRRAAPRRVLDIGCGTGILAMAAAKLWPVPVVAADIDPQAARVAHFNARENRLAARIRTATADGYRHALIARGAPYDVILSNILARPLARLAPELGRHLAPGGIAILSGLLARHERLVLSAHLRAGLALVGRIRKGEWDTLILRKR